ncbi:MAG: flagellar basal body-associated FliL family protein, partial [Candidatus Latescibacterota bacterium]|nr:flagellar basal body-associated FliL family protein [Candidatus Latescibacterota bacterium]
YDGDGVLMKPQDVAIDAEMNLKVGASLGLIKSLILNALSTKYIDQIENERPEFLLELKNELNRKVFNRIPWGEDEDQKAFRVQEVIFTTMIIQ